MKTYKTAEEILVKCCKQGERQGAPVGITGIPFVLEAMEEYHQQFIPTDEEIEEWIESQFLPTSFDDRHNPSEIAKSFTKDGMRIDMKWLRDNYLNKDK